MLCPTSISRPATVLAAVLLVAAGTSRPLEGQAAAGQDASARLATRRAEALFDSGEPRIGELSILARLLVDSADPEEGTVEATIPRQALSGATPDLAVWLVLPRLDGRHQVLPYSPGEQDLSAAAVWTFRAKLDLPEDFLEAAVVVEDRSGGRWGAAVAEFSEPNEAGADPPTQVAVWEAPSPEGAEPSAAEALDATVALRLLPLEKTPAVGRTRFRTLISDPLVSRVDFLLDGEVAASDTDPPFSAVLDLGPVARTREVRAVGYTHDGYPLGDDTLTVNAGASELRVRIARVEPTGDGGVEIAGSVSVPPGETLSALEVYLDDALIARPRGPDFTERFDAKLAGPSSFVRVVARLASGESQEDARLLSAPSERVEVNLVEVYAVVTAPDGAPARQLTRDEVTIRLGKRELPIERFSPADETELRLGLVIDTSGSMESLMTDTKTAGAQFLSNTLRPGDEAFLVDFDTQPRLAHPPSGDVMELIRAFGRFRTDGFTALYDAVIFSMLQFEEGPARRALILLSDGDDYRSKYGQRRCIRYGRDLGVPVYILALGGLLGPRAGLPKVELEGLVEGTGGRIFYIADSAELEGAYAQINRELRSQYLLAFATDRELSQKELDSLSVEVSRPDHRVRAVVAGRRID